MKLEIVNQFKIWIWDMLGRLLIFSIASVYHLDFGDACFI